MLAKFTVASTAANLACLAPMLDLKHAIARRNAELEASGFPPIAPELRSTLAVDALLLSGASALAVAPLLQLLLAHLYFKRGHAWSRILNARLEMEGSGSCFSGKKSYSVTAAAEQNQL